MSSLSSAPRASGSGAGSDPGKRKAPSSSMDPPDGPPVKRAKRSTPVEIKLESLRTTLAEIRPTWELYNTGFFMEEMRQMREEIDPLTLETVEAFIARQANSLREVLGIQRVGLQTASIPPEIPPEQIPSYQRVRNLMISYVGHVQEAFEALVAQVQAKPSPHSFALNTKTWGKLQQRPDAILCRRPASQRGWPIPLMHRAFCTFTRYLHQPPLDKDTENFLKMADRLCTEMPSAFNDETDRQGAFESIFRSLDKNLTAHREYHAPRIGTSSTVKESGAKQDVTKSIPWNGGSLVLMLEEFKNEGGNAYMQVSRSYEVLCGSPAVNPLVEFGNPMFLLCIMGPYLMVCGAVKRKENVHVQPLTTFIPMFPDYGIEGHQVQLAYCLQALKAGLDALQTFWQDVGVIGDGPRNKPQQQKPDCPDNDLLRFDDWQGAFTAPMHEDNHPNKAPSFMATLHKPNSEVQVQVVVKFVYKYIGTYGKGVHEHLHRLGLAPRLYSVVDLHPGLVMVVIEHLGFEEGVGGWVELDTFENRLGDMATPVRKKLDTIIDSLQGQRMVHGDMRPKNIMVQVDEHRHMAPEPVLSLIDFDWAGMVDEACYPPLLNTHIHWPTGAAPYGKIGHNDDRILLENWWSAFVQPANTSQ